MTNPTRAAGPPAPTPPPGDGDRTRPGPARGAVQRALHRFAERLAARPKTVIVVWALLIAVCTPYAMGLDDVLTDQGASKVVPGTSSARADELTKKAFPHRSEREVTVVVEAPDVRAFLASGRFEDARARVEKVLEQEPTNGEAQGLLGSSLIGVQDAEGARAAAEGRPVNISLNRDLLVKAGTRRRIELRDPGAVLLVTSDQPIVAERSATAGRDASAVLGTPASE